MLWMVLQDGTRNTESRFELFALVPTMHFSCEICSFDPNEKILSISIPIIPFTMPVLSPLTDIPKV